MMLPVTSSLCSHIGYDAPSMTLSIRYKPSNKQAVGDLWEYANIVPEKWAEAEAVLADPEGSIGKWFLANIKGRYDGRKVDVIGQMPSAATPDMES